MILTPKKGLKSCIPPISLQRIFENHAYHPFRCRKFLKIMHSIDFDAELVREITLYSFLNKQYAGYCTHFQRKVRYKKS